MYSSSYYTVQYFTPVHLNKVDVNVTTTNPPSLTYIQLRSFILRMNLTDRRSADIVCTNMDMLDDTDDADEGKGSGSNRISNRERQGGWANGTAWNDM